MQWVPLMLAYVINCCTNFPLENISQVPMLFYERKEISSWVWQKIWGDNFDFFKLLQKKRHNYPRKHFVLLYNSHLVMHICDLTTAARIILIAGRQSTRFEYHVLNFSRNFAECRLITRVLTYWTSLWYLMEYIQQRALMHNLPTESSYGVFR